MSGSTIYSVFLAALQVLHTSAYSDKRFRTMTFKTLFGFSKARRMTRYGVRNEALRLSDRSSITDYHPVYRGRPTKVSARKQRLVRIR